MLTARETAEAIEALGYHLSTHGRTKLRYFWPRTLCYAADMQHVTGDELIETFSDMEEKLARIESECADWDGVFSYLRARQKRRRKRARIIRNLIRAQTVLAHCRPGTWAYAVVLAVVGAYDARLLALAEGGAQ